VVGWMAAGLEDHKINNLVN